MTLDDREKVFEEIPESYHGAFLAMGWGGIRPSEVRVLHARHWEGDVLRVVESARDRRVAHPNPEGMKTVAGGKLLPVFEPVRLWLEKWVTPEQIMANALLFTNPRARNPKKQWGIDALENFWHIARRAAGIPEVPLYQGRRLRSVLH